MKITSASLELQIVRFPDGRCHYSLRSTFYDDLEKNRESETHFSTTDPEQLATWIAGFSTALPTPEED